MLWWHEYDRMSSGMGLTNARSWSLAVADCSRTELLHSKNIDGTTSADPFRV